MGTWGFEPLENDSGLDFIEEFLDVESPAGTIRSALAALNKDGYHDIDVVAHAWAACELVAIASTGGDGYDPDDVAYEAAARLRPNKKLIGQCLDVLPSILSEDSELSELVDGENRSEAEDSLARTRGRLEAALKRDKFPRLKVPKIRAVRAYTVPAGNKWMVALSDYVHLTVLDAILDEKPGSIEEVTASDSEVLFRCRYMGAVDELDALGRFRPSGSLAELRGFVTVSGHGCMSDSNVGDFKTMYWLDLGTNSSQLSYEEAKNHTYCPELMPEVLLATLRIYATTGTLELPSLPSPDELRSEFLERCREDWAPFLEGDGGGPFSFPRVYAYDMARYVQYMINYHLRPDWSNAGMCLPDDLHKYFLAGVVAAFVGAYPKASVPESLRPVVGSLGKSISRRTVGATIHILSCLLDEASVIPHVLQEDPPRRDDFLEQAGRMRSELKSKLAAAADRSA